MRLNCGREGPNLGLPTLTHDRQTSPRLVKIARAPDPGNTVDTVVMVGDKSSAYARG